MVIILQNEIEMKPKLEEGKRRYGHRLFRLKYFLIIFILRLRIFIRL